MIFFNFWTKGSNQIMSISKLADTFQKGESGGDVYALAISSESAFRRKHVLTKFICSGQLRLSIMADNCLTSFADLLGVLLTEVFGS